MSNQSTSYTSYSSTSYTSSSSSSGGSNGQTHSHSQTTRSHYNDRDGLSSERITRETGKPTLVESTSVPARGGSRIEDVDGGSGRQNRIEDVTDRVGDGDGAGAEAESDADRRYLEAMEDEYAKREGGA